jgi:hypothetical protein
LVPELDPVEPEALGVGDAPLPGAVVVVVLGPLVAGTVAAVAVSALVPVLVR